MSAQDSNPGNDLTTDFLGKVVIVTGAAMGIGRACAEGFIARGGSVVIADMDVEAGQATATELGERALFSHTDVCDMQAVSAMAELAVTQFGGIDILVNNAGQALKGVVDEISEEHWTRVIDINLNGYWRTMRAGDEKTWRRSHRQHVVRSGFAGFQRVCSLCFFERRRQRPDLAISH